MDFNHDSTLPESNKILSNDNNTTAYLPTLRDHKMSLTDNTECIWENGEVPVMRDDEIYLHVVPLESNHDSNTFKETASNDSNTFKETASNDGNASIEPKETASKDSNTPIEPKETASNDSNTPKETASNDSNTLIESKETASNDSNTPIEPKETASNDSNTPIEPKETASNDSSTPIEPKETASLTSKKAIDGDRRRHEKATTANHNTKSRFSNSQAGKNADICNHDNGSLAEAYIRGGLRSQSNTLETNKQAEPSRENLKMVEVKPVIPRGLINVGNTCYMNSALQCLSCADEYGLCFNPDSTRCFAHTLAILLQQMKSGPGKAVQPDDIKEEIGKHSSLFSGFSQQDSQECLTAILEKSHDDMKCSYISNDTDMTEQSWNTYLLSYGFSKVVEWFQGEIQSTMQCSNKDCEHEIHKNDPFMFLPVSIPSHSQNKRVRLHNCLDAYVAVECISDWPCPNCKQKVDVKRCVKVKKPPNTLMIYLKRFSYNCYGQRYKVNTCVDFPLMLNLSAYVCCKQPDHFYDLIGVINHYGSINGGHYTAKCRYEKRWFDISDESVDCCKNERITTVSGSEYVLVYQRVQFRSQVRADAHHSAISEALDMVDECNAKLRTMEERILSLPIFVNSLNKRALLDRVPPGNQGKDSSSSSVMDSSLNLSCKHIRAGAHHSAISEALHMVDKFNAKLRTMEESLTKYEGGRRRTQVAAE